MIDIHSHVIWDVDDGAASMEDSVAMLNAARESGTTDIVATPHMNSQYVYQPALVSQKIQELAAATGGAPRIHQGCEFHLSVDNLDMLMAGPSAYTINKKQYLLLECPDQHVGKHADRILRQLVDSGIVPIIAHPERVPALQKDPDRLESWIELGCLTQVTSVSILGVFGRATAAVCGRFFQRGLVHMVASDAHDPSYRHTRMDGACAVVRERYGEDAAEILFRDNPRCVIEGFPVAGGKQVFAEARPRRWWHF
jgi:protein-tyrosine phosphatase